MGSEYEGRREEVTEYGYARVSTAVQREALQMDALLAAGVPAENITVDRIKGAAASRPGLDDLLPRLQAGDRLTVWRFDRAFRSTKHLLNLTDDLRERGVEFRSLREQIDTTTATGRFFFTIVAAVGAFEADLIRERTQAGMAASRARGVQLGRKAAANPEQVRLIHQLAGEGVSQARIAAGVGMSRSAVGRVIRQELKTIPAVGRGHIEDDLLDHTS